MAGVGPLLSESRFGLARDPRAQLASSHDPPTLDQFTPRRPPPTMSSNQVLRRGLAVARSTVRCRGSTLATRTYATPSGQEPDPQLNGYPQLPWHSRQSLPPLGWQDPLMRRNFGDTVGKHASVQRALRLIYE